MRVALGRQILILLGVAFLPAMGGAIYFKDKVSWQGPPKPEGSISLETARGWGSNVLWVDARKEIDFEREHIEGALLLNEDRWNDLLPEFLNQWAPDKKIVVYCSSESCAASDAVAKRLRGEVGLPEVYVLDGGWESWRRAQP